MTVPNVCLVAAGRLTRTLGVKTVRRPLATREQSSACACDELLKNQTFQLTSQVVGGHDFSEGPEVSPNAVIQAW